MQGEEGPQGPPGEPGDKGDVVSISNIIHIYSSRHSFIILHVKLSNFSSIYLFILVGRTWYTRASGSGGKKGRECKLRDGQFKCNLKQVR